MTRADRDSSSIHVYDGRGSSDIIHTFDKLHSSPVIMMKVIQCCMYVCVYEFIFVHISMPSYGDSVDNTVEENSSVFSLI